MILAIINKDKSTKLLKSYGTYRNIANTRLSLKINESRYIVLFVISGSVKKLFPIDYVNMYMFLIFFVSRFCPVEKCGIQKWCHHINQLSWLRRVLITVCMHAEIRTLCDSLIPRCVRIIFLQKFWEVKKFGVLRLVKKSLNKEVLRESILKIYIPFTKTSSHLTIIASYFLQYMPGVNRSAFPYIMYWKRM